MSLPSGLVRNRRSGTPKFPVVRDSEGAAYFHRLASTIGWTGSSCTLSVGTRDIPGIGDDVPVLILTATASATISAKCVLGALNLGAPGIMGLMVYTPETFGGGGGSPNSCTFGISSDNFASNHFKRFKQCLPGWNSHRHSVLDMVQTGTVNLSAINSVQIEISSADSGSQYCIALLRWGMIAEGGWVMTLDDEQLTGDTVVIEKFQNAGRKVTMAVLAGINGGIGFDSNYMSLVDVQDRIAQGHPTIMHSYANIDNSQQADGGLADRAALRTWMRDNGLVTDNRSLITIAYNVGGGPEDAAVVGTSMTADGTIYGLNAAANDRTQPAEHFAIQPFQIQRQNCSDANYCAPLAAPVLALGAAGSSTTGVHEVCVVGVMAYGGSTFKTEPLNRASITVASNERIDVSAIPVLPAVSGATISREIYMTKAGGGALYLAATINDNSTTTTTLNVADGSLTTLCHQYSSFPLSVMLQRIKMLGEWGISLGHTSTGTPDGISGIVLAPAGYDALLSEADRWDIRSYTWKEAIDRIESQNLRSLPTRSARAVSDLPAVAVAANWNLQDLTKVLATPGGSSAVVDGTVQQVTDSSGNAINLITNSDKHTLRQVTNGTKTFYAVEVNSDAITTVAQCLKYSTDAGATHASGFTIAAPYTKVLVARILTTSPAGNIFIADGRISGKRNAIFWDNSGVGYKAYNSYNVAPGTTLVPFAALNSWHIVAIVVRAGATEFWFNGECLAVVGSVTDLDGFMLERYDASGTGLIQIAASAVLSTDGRMAGLIEPIIADYAEQFDIALPI